MNAQLPVHETTPGWLSAEMPPGYENRLAEMRRLSDELRVMDRVGRLLWQTGDELIEAVQDAFIALGCETERIPRPVVRSVAARLDGRRRLLVHASGSSGIVQKKDAELAHVFQLLHEQAEGGDRVVLVTNCEPGLRPAERPESVGPEALALLRRLGANVLPGPTLFALWTLSLQDKPRAHTFAERLHEHEGGVFVLPMYAER